MGTCWEDMEHISTPRATRLLEGERLVVWSRWKCRSEAGRNKAAQSSLNVRRREERKQTMRKERK
jgi:hypothetical protein